jgi:hypothetical protein
MFLREQQALWRELRDDFCMEQELLEAHIWPPGDRRHTLWLYRSLCQCDERGNIIHGSRQRNPFPPYVKEASCTSTS